MTIVTSFPFVSSRFRLLPLLPLFFVRCPAILSLPCFPACPRLLPSHPYAQAPQLLYSVARYQPANLMAGVCPSRSVSLAVLIRHKCAGSWQRVSVSLQPVFIKHLVFLTEFLRRHPFLSILRYLTFHSRLNSLRYRHPCVLINACHLSVAFSSFRSLSQQSYFSLVMLMLHAS